MSAKNPLRVSDLIKKYGWTIMPYLSDLGPTVLAEAQVLFVDSGHTNALDADDTEHGHEITKPLATWDFANGLCTAGEQSIIFLAPGHNENLGAAQIDLDVIGVHTIGIGSGSLKPRIDYDDVASSIDIGANNVSIQNVDFLPSTGSVLIGIHVETDVTNLHLKDIRFLIGEDGAGTDEFVKAVEMTSGNDDCVFEDVTIFAHDSSAQATHGIHIAAAADRTIFRNVVIDGPYATGGIVEAAAGVNLIVENCAVDVSGTNYGFDGSSTFAKRVNNVDGQVREDDSESLLVEARGSAAYPSGITNESIWAYLLSKSSTPAASSYDNEEDSLEAISDKVDAIGSPTDVTDAVPNTPTANSLQDILSELDGANTYDNTTDSLEAISNFIRTGVTLGAGINIDHLMKTAVVDEQNMAAEIATGSALAHILVKAAGGNVTDFDPTTDSLEAIADAVTGFTTAVSQTPTARSVQDILEKDNSGSFDDATDSLEAIRDHIDGTTVLGGIQLDHLAKTASAGTNYPTEVTTDSILAMMMAAAGNPNTFNKTTDSLEAISVALAAGTGCNTVLGSNQLDTLAGTDTTVAIDGDLEAHCVAGSLLAHIMSASKDATDYKCSTDSLQAISDFVRTGVTLGAGIQLDHLLKTSTGVALDGDLTTFTADLSVMAHVMSATAVGSSFDASTDSLEAIAAALAAGTGASVALDGDQLDHLVGTTTSVAAGSDLETYCVSGSLMAHVLSVGADVTTFDCRTDSLEVISDKLGAYTFDGGADDEDTIMAHLDLIYADTAAIDPGAKRLITATLTDWALSATNGLFTVSGMVRARIWGEVLVAVAGVTTNLKISCTPTAPGGLVDIASNLDCDSDAPGTIYKMNATFGSAMVEVTGGVSADDGVEVILPAGVVQMGSSANEAGGGSIQWFCQYEPLEAGATVTAT